MRPRVVESVLDLIGLTPLVRLPRSIATAGVVLAKMENMGPGGSVKDRIALAMIAHAEKTGELKPGGTVVEPTSGNTGIGLAIVCASKGYKLVLTMPRSMSLERRALLEAYGAEVIFTDAEDAMEGAVRRAAEIAKERGGYMPSQFDNAENPNCHEATTAEEIFASVGSFPDAFVSAVGTGGTVTGVGRALRRRGAATRVVAVEAESSAVLRGGDRGPTKIQGIGAGFVPAIFDRSVVDEIRSVSDHDAWSMKDRLAKEAGLLVGISAGANVCVAVEVAASLTQALGRDALVVTILCDTGERYFSLAEHFSSGACVAP